MKRFLSIALLIIIGSSSNVLAVPTIIADDIARAMTTRYSLADLVSNTAIAFHQTNHHFPSLIELNLEVGRESTKQAISDGTLQNPLTGNDFSIKTAPALLIMAEPGSISYELVMPQRIIVSVYNSDGSRCYELDTTVRLHHGRNTYDTEHHYSH